MIDRSRALAENGRFVRALARRLVRPGEDPEDVAQETWLASLRDDGAAEPKPGFTLRAWLAGIARNVARQSRRAAERRARREATIAASPRAGDVPSPADTAERIETLRRLVDAVESLAEPYRGVLFLRYFEDLSPAAIAHRLGVPEATARTRLRRAHALLRERLDREHGGERAAWTAALSAAVALPSPTALGAILAMTLPTKIAGGLVALAAAAVLLFIFMSGGTEPPKSPSASVVAHSRSEAPGGAATARDAVEPAASAAPAAPAFAVRGRTRLTDGRPLPGAGVRLKMIRGYEPDEGEILAEDLVVSGADGAFEWTPSAPDETVTIRYHGEEAGYFAFTADQLRIRGEGTAADLDVTLHPRDSLISGTVVDLAGNPVPGAIVGYWNHEVGSDASGRFELSVPAGTGFLWARAAGFAFAEEEIASLSPETPAVVEMRLRPGHRLFGRVIGPNGEPIAAARVTEWTSSRLSEARSGDDGAFVIEHLDPASSGYFLKAERDGFGTASLPVAANAAREPQTLALAAATPFEVVVTGEDERPVPGAVIDVRAANGARISRRLSGDDGRRAFTNVGSGPVVVIVERRGFGAAVATRDLVADSAERTVLPMSLALGGSLGGRVQDESGEPVPGAIVSFSLTEPAFRPILESLTTRTGADGRFRVDGLPAAAGVSMEISASRHRRFATMSPPIGATDAVFTLETITRLRGRVVDDATGAPIPRFRARFVIPTLLPGDRHAGKVTRETWFSHPDGEFELRDEVEPGLLYAVEACAPGYAPATAPRVIAEMKMEPLVLRLRAESSLSGFVLDANGDAPIEGAVIRIFSSASPLTTDVRGRDAERAAARTDERGAFEIGALAAGRIALAIEHPDWGLSIDGPFDVPESGRAAERVIRLRRSAVLSGIAVDESGAPIPGVAVRLSARDWGGAEFERRLHADSAGRFSFGALPSGRYHLNYNRLFEAQQDPAFAGTIVSYDRPLRLEGADPVEIRLGPDDGSAALAGTIECGEGVAMPELLNVRISAAFVKGSNWEDIPSRILRVRDGRFVATRLAEAEYVVWAYAMGDASLRGEARLFLAAGRSDSVTIRLEKKER